MNKLQTKFVAKFGTAALTQLSVFRAFCTQSTVIAKAAQSYDEYFHRSGKSMSIQNPSRTLVAVCLLSIAPLLLAETATAQSDAAPSLEEVRAEVAEAMEAIAAYSEAQREAAAAEARIALDQMDAAVEARQRETREAWAELTEPARENANARLAELQSALVNMAERVGKLQAGADSAWVELNEGLMAAWSELSAAVSASLEAPAPAE